MRKTSTTLSDGRELIYFDRDGRPARTARDERGLAPAQPSSQLRYDPLIDTWVTIAAHRQDRTYLPPENECPFCPSRPGHRSEIPEQDYDVVVFENQFPSYARTGTPPAAPRDRYDLHAGPPSAPGVGRCEVICFTPVHDSCFADLTVDQARLVLDAWTDRTEALLARPGVVQVYCFENRGHEIGVTEQHPHGQIYAYPFVTARTARALDSATVYRRRTGANLFDDVVAFERREATRVVTSGEYWTAFVPYSAHWPFEVHLYPNRRVGDLTALDEEEREEFCLLYLEMLRRFDALFAAPIPYISGWHQAPMGTGEEFALHLELFTVRRSAEKLKYPAGSESGMDAFISDIVPEAAADALRGAQ